MPDNSTQIQEKSISIDNLAREVMSSLHINKLESDRLAKLKVEENMISAYTPYMDKDWLDKRPQTNPGNYTAPKIEIIEGRDLFNFVSTNIIYKFREIAAAQGLQMGHLLEIWINELLEKYEPNVFDLTMTANNHFSLNSCNMRLTRSTYLKFERKAKYWGLGNNQLLTYFLTDVITGLTTEKNEK